MYLSAEKQILFLFLVILSFVGGYFLRNILLRKHNHKLIVPDRTRVENEFSDKAGAEQLRLDLADQAVQAERKRIANELHDDTVQRMVAVRLRLEQILYYPIHDGVTLEVNGLRKELDKIVAALRFLINDLTQPRFEQRPFSYLIDELAGTLGAMHHVKLIVKSTRPDLEFSLAPQVKQELYYLVHEVAHNFLKSSMGFQLNIHLHWSDQLIIHIKDNGQGLQRGRGYGMGMVSMHERANRIQAELVFTSLNDGLGVTIKVKKPHLQ
jgi:signal transduction histidine kinase